MSDNDFINTTKWLLTILMTSFWVSIALLAVVVGISFRDSRSELRRNKRDYVYATCQASRIGDRVTEQECAEAQDQAGVEYLCAQANNLPSNHCWVEDNDHLGDK